METEGPKGARSGIGFVCTESTAGEIVRAPSSTRLKVEWIARSFGEVGALVRRRWTPAILIEFGVDRDAFWRSLEDLLQRPSQSALVVFGQPNRTEVFRLARVGVDSYFESLAEAQAAMSDPVRRSSIEALMWAARRNVGELGLKETLRAIRANMFREALRLTGGNRHAAARLLRVDRRYVLKMLKDVPLLRTA